MADAADSKSAAPCGRVGSTPISGTKNPRLNCDLLLLDNGGPKVAQSLNNLAFVLLAEGRSRSPVCPGRSPADRGPLYGLATAGACRHVAGSAHAVRCEVTAFWARALTPPGGAGDLLRQVKRSTLHPCEAPFPPQVRSL